MAGDSTVPRLAQLTGLDSESVQTQLVPFLSTFTTADALRVHLVDLLGSSAQARSFISDYVHSRFPKAQKPDSAPAAARADGPAPGSKGPAKPKLTAKQRLLQPAKPRRFVNEATSQDAFGPIGTVYHKDRDNVLDGYRTPPSGPASGAAPSDRALPKAGPAASSSRLEAATPGAPPSTVRESAERHDSSSAAAAVAADDLEQIVPTAAMTELDSLLAQLTDSAEQLGTPNEIIICFCHGRVHPLHPYQPLCPACALPLCTSLLPSPLQRSSRCPSCAQSPILPDSSPARAQLTASLQSQRAALEVEERQRIERVRRERALKTEDARNRATAAANAFPVLGGLAGTVQSPPADPTFGLAGYGARSNAVALAMGRRQPTEAERSALQQRTHRVLRIPAKGSTVNKKSSKKKSKPKSEKTVDKSKTESGAKPNVASTLAAADTDEDGDSGEDDGALGESVEVSVTVLVADLDDDGWQAHQPKDTLDSAEAHKAAIDRQRTLAATLGGQRPLANPRLDPKSRPNYTSRSEREKRAAQWLASTEADDAEPGEG